ncbi:MAG: tRNA (5-methylaminomethyl-2-thiouridine)(34)-methyltransferase MnmD [Propionivibrio sp.]|nr:tRNA (5-methylaminomethyl-2-thiouridine)(34)-methyltransferase MnmD [Propionivibrio sp.]
MALEPAHLVFNAEGTPCSEQFSEVYHSADGGHAQARHVFLGGNDLPARWRGRKRFVILETGFGLGLNLLATWLEWLNDDQRCVELHFVSFEKYPLRIGDLARAHAAWPEFGRIAEALRNQWPVLSPGVHRLELAQRRIILTLGFGDALQLLPEFEMPVDAFYLDGFSPAKNPEMWSGALCRSLARLAVPGATLATWSVAGTVRRALSAANFVVEKRPGFASKRQMLVGRYDCQAMHGDVEREAQGIAVDG